MPLASSYATGDVEYDLGLDSSNNVKRNLRGSLIKDGDLTNGVMAYVTTGAFGGGYGLIDGTGQIGLFSTANGTVFSIGFGSSSLPSAITQKFTVDNTGFVAVTGQFQVQGGNQATFTGLTVIQNSENNTNRSRFTLAKDRAGAIVQNGDNLGSVEWLAYNGTGFDIGAYIWAIVDGTPGASNDMPTTMQFYTCPDGSSTALERMRIASTGDITIGGAANTAISGYASRLQTLTDVNEWNISCVKFTNDTEGAMLSLAKNRNATIGSNTIVQNNDVLGDIRFYGNSGTLYYLGGIIQVLVDGTPGATNDMPARMIFGTTADGAGAPTTRLTIDNTGKSTFTGPVFSSSTTGIGYSAGAGNAVTQTGSRTTAVTINAACGAITLVSAAGSGSATSFTVNNSVVAATDTIICNQKSGTDKYTIRITNVAAGSFEITFVDNTGTTTEQPVFNFAVIKAVTS